MENQTKIININEISICEIVDCYNKQFNLGYDKYQIKSLKYLSDNDINEIKMYIKISFLCNRHQMIIFDQIILFKKFLNKFIFKNFNNYCNNNDIDYKLLKHKAIYIFNKLSYSQLDNIFKDIEGTHDITNELTIIKINIYFNKLKEKDNLNNIRNYFIKIIKYANYRNKFIYKSIKLFTIKQLLILNNLSDLELDSLFYYYKYCIECNTEPMHLKYNLKIYINYIQKSIEPEIKNNEYLIKKNTLIEYLKKNDYEVWYFYDFTPECFSYLNSLSEDKLNDIFKDFKKDDFKEDNYENTMNIIKNNILNKIKEEKFDNRKIITYENNDYIIMDIEDIKVIDFIFYLNYYYCISINENNNNIGLSLKTLYNKSLYNLPIKHIITIFYSILITSKSDYYKMDFEKYCDKCNDITKFIKIDNEINLIYDNIDINKLYEQLKYNINYFNDLYDEYEEINYDDLNPYEYCNILNVYERYKNYNISLKLLKIFYNKFNKLQKENEELKKENDSLKKRKREDDNNNEIIKKIK